MPAKLRFLRACVALVAWALGGALVAGPGCYSADSPPADRCEPTLDSIHRDVFGGACDSATCHGGVQPAAALDLHVADPEERIVNAGAGTCEGWKLVEPGDPDHSLLWVKVYSDHPPCGDPMPLGTRLSARKLSCVRDWIRALPPPSGDGGADGSTDGGGDGSSCEKCGGGVCINVDTDPAHCGSCDVSCAAGAACSNGACACDGTLTSCSGACVDVTADPSHCGRCDVACPAGALCSGSACVCTGGLSECNGKCVDTTSDPTACGGCNKPCPSNEVCLLGACAAGCGSLKQCGSACIDVTSSTLNCGDCNRPCPLGASCVGSQCLCPAGFLACNGQCLNVGSDPSNCGSCGAVCGSGQVCASGACVCPGGGTVCGASCVDLAFDMSNCGTCGRVCASAQTCTSGACICPGGGSLCGASCVDLQSDAGNCGTCGKACGTGQSCVSGACTCGSSASVSFAGNIQPIFSGNCTNRGCHSGLKPAGSMNLSSGVAYGNLVGVNSSECAGRKRVQQGDPSVSYLVQKLLGVSMCSGTQMPKIGTSLPKAQLDLIGAWICQNAPNN